MRTAIPKPVNSKYIRILTFTHVLPPRRVQHILTLSSKYFSPFPHGTCSLSDSNEYLDADEVYHPLLHSSIEECDWLRNSLTRIAGEDRTITYHGAPFQDAHPHPCRRIRTTYLTHSRTSLDTITVLFTRRYWGHLS